jgi:hypothetical protein
VVVRRAGKLRSKMRLTWFSERHRRSLGKVGAGWEAGAATQDRSEDHDKGKARSCCAPGRRAGTCRSQGTGDAFVSSIFNSVDGIRLASGGSVRLRTDRGEAAT